VGDKTEEHCFAFATPRLNPSYPDQLHIHLYRYGKMDKHVDDTHEQIIAICRLHHARIVASATNGDSHQNLLDDVVFQHLGHELGAKNLDQIAI
jgi:hypothetical protein